MTIEAVFFDIGDTLLTDRPSLEDRIWSASVSCGIQYDRDRLTPALRRVEDYALDQYALGHTQDDISVMRETALRLLGEVGVPHEANQVESLVAAFLSEPFVRELHPNALEAIDRLKARGFLVGVISDWDASLADLLASLGLMPKLDALAISGIVGCTKPCRALFEDALRQAGATAAASVHIGDFYELDVVGARSAGMQAVLFDWRGRVPDADCPRATTFDEVVQFLDSLPSPA